MKNEIVFKNINIGMKVAEMLLNEDYVVLLSREDNFLVVNFEFAHGADRNEIIFMRRDEYEELEDIFIEDILNDVTRDYLNGTLGAVLAPRIAKFKDDITSIGK